MTPPKRSSPPFCPLGLFDNQTPNTGWVTRFCARRLYQTGVTLSTEILLNANPKIPSNFAAIHDNPFSVVISANFDF